LRGYGSPDVGPLTPQDKLDVGNYRPGSAAFTLAAVASAAHEMGDDEIAAAALAESTLLIKLLNRTASLLTRAFPSYVRRHRSCPIAATRFLAGHRRGRTRSSRTARTSASDCAYPEVLVAWAISTQGDDLQVLHPGSNTSSRQALRISRLRPRHTYRIRCAEEGEVTARDEGSAVIHVRLDGRTEVVITLPDRKPGVNSWRVV
jgi:hypothetical protein